MKELRYKVLAVIIALVISPSLSGQQPATQPPHCAQILFCLFNQEAVASDPAGIHKYSEDLIGLIVPLEAGKVKIDPLAKRLARAEQMARTGKAKLVPEADIVRAFNDLMTKVGAPSSLRADEASMRRFREHTAAIRAFPALFSADRNGTNCNPGEAVFLLSLLMSGNGLLYEKNLDAAQMLMQPYNHQSGEGRSFGVVSIGAARDAQRLLSSYMRDHKRNEAIALFNNLVRNFGL